MAWWLAAGLGCDRGLQDDVDALEKRVAGLEQAQTDRAENDKALALLETRVLQLEAQQRALQLQSEGYAAELQTLSQELAEAERPPTPEKPVVEGRPDPAARYFVDVSDAHIRGTSEAKITIVIFSDFQCPFCARVQDTLRQIEKRYDTDVRLVAKHNPLALHKEALPAAIAAEAAGRQGKFFEMADLLYAHPRELTRENFLKWAKDLGLDVARFEKDLEDEALGRLVEDHQKQAQALGARGTPAFFINGRFLSGAQPLASFQALIDEELEEANRLVATGTPRDAVYETLMRSAKREL